MTQNTVYHTNKLIAEFMGINLQGGGRSVFDEVNLKYFRKTTYEQDGLCEFCHNHVNHGHHIKCYVLDTDKLAYHSSWDWLMPVVEKIYQTGISGGMMDDYQAALASADIGRVYAEVVKFIKWFNNR